MDVMNRVIRHRRIVGGSSTHRQAASRTHAPDAPADRKELGTLRAACPVSRIAAGLCGVALMVMLATLPSAHAQINDLADGEARIRFDPEGFGVAVPVAVNGRRRLLTIDTGASVSVFDKSLAIVAGPALRSVYVHSSDGGVNRMDLFRPPDASIGGLPLGGVSEVLYTDLAHLRVGSGTDVYGHLGLDFLRDRIMRIDYDRGEVSFLRSLPDNPGAPFLLDLSSRNLPPKVLADVAGIGEQWFVIDTGSTSVGSFDARLLAHLCKDGSAALVETITSESITKSSVLRRFRLRDAFTLGGFRHRGLIFEEGPDNILGSGYLERYLVTLDFPEKRMYLKRSDRFDQPCLVNLSRAEPWWPNGVMTIRVVAANGPADSAGLKAGDIVEEIDGRRVASLSPGQIWRPVCQPGRHRMRVRRGDESLEITLILSETPRNAKQVGGGVPLNK